MTAARTGAALAAVLGLALAACFPSEDEAGVPTAEDTTAATSADGMPEVRQAAAATLERGGARVTITFGGDEDVGGDEDAGDDGDGLVLEGVDDYEQDRGRLEPAGRDQVLVVDGSEVFVRSAELDGATWGRFDLEEVTAEGTAATVDLRLLPLTDSADVLRTLADAGGAARADGDGYVVTLSAEEEQDVLGGENYWLQRYVQTGIDQFDLRVGLDGDAVGQVSYSVPTPAASALEQGEQVGDDAEGDDDGAGIPVTITYEEATGSEPIERPADGEVVEVPAAEVADLLGWVPTAGQLRDPAGD